MQANSIDEVIQHLDTVIDWAHANHSRLGYFAALYRRTTLQVKRGIAEGFFEDGKRMEHLDVVFANRYLEAVDQYWAGKTPTNAWQFAFDTAAKWRPVVLQHLLLGMSAHINLDLCLAVIQCQPAHKLPHLYKDFMRINFILADMLADVQQQLVHVWPVMRLLNWAAGRSDDLAVSFFLRRARTRAWRAALTLSRCDPEEHPSRIDDLDRWVVRRGRLICTPGISLTTTLFLIRLCERGSVAKIIENLR